MASRRPSYPDWDASESFTIYGRYKRPRIGSNDEDAYDELLAARRPTPARKSGSIPDHEIVRGVSLDDLPIVPPKSNSILGYYKNLPVLRKLDWRTDASGELIRRELKDSNSLLAALVQTRGQLAPESCNCCRENGGPWKSPKTDMDDDIRVTALFDDDVSSSVSSSSTQPKTQAIRVRPVVTKNSSDGKVLPFPLRPEAINDLPLLKQAVEDLTAHLKIIKRRVSQLEEREKEKSSENPWNLV